MSILSVCFVKLIGRNTIQMLAHIVVGVYDPSLKPLVKLRLILYVQLCGLPSSRLATPIFRFLQARLILLQLTHRVIGGMGRLKVNDEVS